MFYGFIYTYILICFFQIQVFWRQSILKKAFAGQLLTATELAACRAEPDWEPAGPAVTVNTEEVNWKNRAWVTVPAGSIISVEWYIQ